MELILTVVVLCNLTIDRCWRLEDKHGRVSTQQVCVDRGNEIVRAIKADMNKGASPFPGGKYKATLHCERSKST